jgi:hypothetical protein
MLNVRDHQTGHLFNPLGHMGAKRRALMEGSWAGLVRQLLLTCLPLVELARMFHEGMGRPGKDLHVAAGVLILQQLHDLTDPETVQAVAFNESWHYALDIDREEDKYICEKTLRNYRAKAVTLGLEKVLFNDLTDQLVKIFNVNTTHQRLDSTAIRSNMAKLTRLGVVCQTMEKFLRELRRHDTGMYARVERALLGRYVEGDESGCFGVCKPSEAQRRLPRAAADLLALVRAFAGTTAAGLAGYRLMQRVLGEQCEVVAGGEGEGEKLRVKENTELTGDVLQNPSDPDNTYNSHKGQGYTVQIMETFNPGPNDAAGQNDLPDEMKLPAQPRMPDLITHMAVGPMTGHDKDAVMPALKDTQERGIAPELILADTHYGVEEQRQAATGEGVELLSPAQPPKGSRQEPRKISLEQFVLDDKGFVKTCPAGQAPLSTSLSDGGNYQALFNACTCANCPLRGQCPVEPPRSAHDATMRLKYDRDRVAMRQRRLAEEQPHFTDRYRWRAGIEATMSRYKHQMGMAALRVRGLAAVTYEAFMGALGLNILRCARCMAINARG